MNRYFDLADRWNDLGVIMRLTLSELDVYVDQTNRLIESKARR